jgi:hypothetical protein
MKRLQNASALGDFGQGCEVMRLPILMTLHLSTAALGEVADVIAMRKLESGLGC